jgi:hypothetical protein
MYQHELSSVCKSCFITSRTPFLHQWWWSSDLDKFVKSVLLIADLIWFGKVPDADDDLTWEETIGERLWPLSKTWRQPCRRSLNQQLNRQTKEAVDRGLPGDAAAYYEAMMANGLAGLGKGRTMEGFWSSDIRIYSRHVTCERSRCGPGTAIMRFGGASSHVEKWEKVFVVVGSRREGGGRDRLRVQVTTLCIYLSVDRLVVIVFCYKK